MALLHVAKITAARKETTLQVAKVSATTPAVTTSLVLQVAGISADILAATPTLSVSASPTGTVNPGDTVTLTATAGGTWTSMGWSQTAGTSVTLSGPETVKTFVAPASVAGTLISIAVNVSGPSGDATAVVSVPVAPQVDWYLDGGVWVPTGGFTDVLGV